MEDYDRKLEKVIKSKKSFPKDEDLLKTLYLKQ